MRRGLFLLAVLLQVAAVVAWAGGLEWERARAPRIRLAAAPVDPRDLLRGDYVRLSYGISDVPWTAFEPAATPIEPGRTAFVVLAPRDGLHAVVRASADRAQLRLAPGERLLTGRVQWADPRRGVRLRYGIERYYVPEGKGALPAGRLEAEVALTASGRPYLLGLFVDGRPYP